MDTNDLIDVRYKGSEAGENSIVLKLELDDLEDPQAAIKLLETRFSFGDKVSMFDVLAVWWYISGENAKRKNPHLRNNHVYWANVNRYMDHLLNKQCGKHYIYEYVNGVDSYREALGQILNSSNRIYSGKDDLFARLVEYYCDQEKIVKME